MNTTKTQTQPKTKPKTKQKQTTQNKHDKFLNYFCEAGEAGEAGEYLVKYQVLRKENTRLRK